MQLMCRALPRRPLLCHALPCSVVSCVAGAVPCVVVSVSYSCCAVCCLGLGCNEVDLPCHVVVVSDLFDFAPRPYLIFAPVFVIIIFCSTFLNFFYLYYDHLQV